MTPEFLKAYTEANNRSIGIMAKLQSKGILQEGIDDQLVKDFYTSQEEVKKFNEQFIALSKQGS